MKFTRENRENAKPHEETDRNLHGKTHGRSYAYSITCHGRSYAYVIILQTRSRSGCGVAVLNSLLRNSLSADASQGLPSDAYASRANSFIEVLIFCNLQGKNEKMQNPMKKQIGIYKGK